MNDIIREIEAEQLRTDITDFNVGDTVQVYAKLKKETVKDYRYLKVL